MVNWWEKPSSQDDLVCPIEAVSLEKWTAGTFWQYKNLRTGLCQSQAEMTLQRRHHD